MEKYSERRNFLKTLVAVPALTAVEAFANGHLASAQDNKIKAGNYKLKISLNAYSFNDPLSKGKMNLDALLDFCAAQNFDAVDLTAYYFPGYPDVPSDEYLYHIKRKAFQLGLAISGTGVRNDFTDPDESKRKKDIQLVKNWIIGASKLGAPVIRIFTGKSIPQGYTWEQVAKWMVKDIRACVEYGKQHGIVVAIQNHDDFIQTAEQAKKILDMVGSEWFGLVLDIGSYRTGDPYKEIEYTAPYAVNWQIKEDIFINGKEAKPDLKKIMGIIKASGYRGYLPIETLGPGDPAVKVPQFLVQVREALV